MTKSYVVVKDEDGCKECLHGRMWAIVRPDGVELSTTFDDLEHTQWICGQLNEAYKLGKGERRV